ncbi:RNA polymerase sigma factor [Mycolicibacterium psychrotolerans]|uniref:RNA polymerase sigma factor n=1 Tax=Mycolicibacterium psychrotolerans TaxID=216929 RepID=UPI003D67942D
MRPPPHRSMQVWKAASAQRRCNRDAPAGGDRDRELAAAAAAGSIEAFEELVRRHGPALYRYARRMTRDADAVNDIVQETFVAAWRQIGNFRGDSAVLTWLFAICARKVTDSHRVKRAIPIDDRLIEPVSQDAGSSPFTFASNSAFLDAMEEALAELPPRQRAVWMLREIEMLTFPEVGNILNLSPDAARGHHHRARVTLQQRLQQWR